MLQAMNMLMLNWKDIRNPAAGGAEVLAFSLARRLVRDGHQIVVFSRQYPGGVSEEQLDGITIKRRGSPLSVYARAAQYYRSLAVKPDLVLEMINTLPWQTPLYVPRNRRLAFVNQLAKEVFLYELPWPLSHLAYAFERVLYAPYRRTHILCSTQSTRKELGTFGIPAENVHVFPLGIDHDIHRPGLKKSVSPLFVFVGRLVRMKRADLCVCAFDVVRQKYPAAKLVIVGRGPQETKLQQLIAERRLENHVSLLHHDQHFLISANQQRQKVEIMQEAWALLLPSVKEGWGMVVTEAAACGTPAIVSNVTGLRDTTVHDKTGLVMSANPSPEELAAAIIRMIAEPGLRETLSAGARQWSLLFHGEASYQAFREILETHLQQRGPPASLRHQ